MTRTLPIDRFHNPEHIIELKEYLRHDGLFDLICVLFGDEEYAKTGCFVSTTLNQPYDASAIECKTAVSRILTDEEIEHGYDTTSNSPMIFVGDLSLLPDKDDVFNPSSHFNYEPKAKAQVGRFLGVPDEDNAHLEQSNRNSENPTYPTDAVDLTPKEIFYCRLLSWHSSPTRQGVERATNHGKSRYNALTKAINAHPEYETTLRLTLHMNLIRNSGKFYGKLPTEIAQDLLDEYNELRKQVNDDLTEHPLETYKF